MARGEMSSARRVKRFAAPERFRLGYEGERERERDGERGWGRV